MAREGGDVLTQRRRDAECAERDEGVVGFGFRVSGCVERVEGLTQRRRDAECAEVALELARYASALESSNQTITQSTNQTIPLNDKIGLTCFIILHHVKLK